MGSVLTPDGWGQVLRSQSARGRTSYLVKGAGFEGWYDALQVTADFADDVDDVVPNEDNETTLPYPSKPQGPGWDGSTSTIQPDIDPHLDMGHASDSLTGDDTDEDPVEADIEGLFEPHSRLSGVRARRVHFAGSDDPILDVSTIPDDSPVGLDESPINPDNVSTDDLFSRSAATYDRLVIEDDLSFLRFASEDDDDDHKRQQDDRADDSDDDSDDDNSDDSSGDDDSDDDDSSSPDGESSSSGDDGGGSHTASVALAMTTTADLHFLANFCLCAEELPLHSKSEHRELVAEGGLKQRKKKGKPLGSQPLSGKHGDSNPTTPEEAGYTKGAKGVAKTIKQNPKPRQDKGQYGNKKRKVERPIQYAAAGNTNGVDPQERDLNELHDRYNDENQLFHPNELDLVDHSLDSEDNADLYNHYASTRRQADGYDKYIGSNGDGTYHLIASGGGKLPKGKQYGHYDSYQAAHDAVMAIIERNHARHGSVREYKGWLVNEHGQAMPMPKTAAPAQPPQPTQIESQIEQLMQFWAVDNNGWWHWTGSQADLAMLNQMQQQMMAVGQQAGPPGQMQTQSSFVIEANTPAPWREYLQTIASDKLVALAAWKDVVEKSKRLRSEGAVDVEVFKPDVITAYIQGDHGRYYTTVQRLGSVPGVGRQGLTSSQVSGWSCECEWGHWAWLRKRSFVGRMCSHAYALFSEMRSLDAKARKTKGQPGRFASVAKTSWARNEQGGFEWVSNDPTMPTAALVRVGSAWGAKIWSDGTAEDSMSLDIFQHSEQARRAAARVINAHVKLADDSDGNVTLVDDPYAQDGDSESEDPQAYNYGPGPGIEQSKQSNTLSAFAEHDDGQDDEGPEEDDNGIEEEEDPRDDESLDEEIADDENDSDDGSDEDPGEDVSDSDDDEGDGGHDEPHRRDHDDDEGTDNPGDESDDEGIEKQSVAALQAKHGLTHLAGGPYSEAEKNRLVREGEGKFARNYGDLDISNTHYEAQAKSAGSDAEDVLAFLF